MSARKLDAALDAALDSRRDLDDAQRLARALDAALDDRPVGSRAVAEIARLASDHALARSVDRLDRAISASDLDLDDPLRSMERARVRSRLYRYTGRMDSTKPVAKLIECAASAVAIAKVERTRKRSTIATIAALDEALDHARRATGALDELIESAAHSRDPAILRRALSRGAERAR
jgi:hypothetical protein